MVIEPLKSKNFDLEPVNEKTKEPSSRIEEKGNSELPAKDNAPERNCLSVSKIRSLKLLAKRLQNQSKSIEGNTCSYSTEEEAQKESSVTEQPLEKAKESATISSEEKEQETADMENLNTVTFDN